MERRDLYQAAFEKWGLVPQILKAAEEFAECAAAIVRYVNDPSPKNEYRFLGEFADLDIMRDQIMCFLSENKMNVIDEYQFKVTKSIALDRLSSRIQEKNGVE